MYNVVTSMIRKDKIQINIHYASFIQPYQTAIKE